MNHEPLVSLCLPTNGVPEWVFPVLDSIFRQDIPEGQYEIVITDNGKNQAFQQGMQPYLERHANIVYEKTDALPFLNEIEAYQRAKGKLLKFVNHRTMLCDGTLRYLLALVEQYEAEAPILYFGNGVLKMGASHAVLDSFDSFVRGLSYWSSWSTGMAIWRKDFVAMRESIQEYNELFPHTSILFHIRDREKYILDNTVIFQEIPQGNKPKGDYDLFHAFGVEYPWIICTLLRDKSISAETFRSVSGDNLTFVADLYISYCLRKLYCSYDLSSLEKIFGVFYSKSAFYQRVAAMLIKKVLRAPKRFLRL